MTTAQVPVGTPFTASSTAADVLSGLDLTGHEVIVTGGHGRLGREVTRALSTAGAAVTVAARDPSGRRRRWPAWPGCASSRWT